MFNQLILGGMLITVTIVVQSVFITCAIQFRVITLDENWRILASMTAVNGLIIFGLNTAFLVEFTRRLTD